MSAKKRESGKKRKAAVQSTLAFAKAPRSLRSARGAVKVAKYYPGKAMPVSAGYRNILIHTSSARLGGQLSPYHLRNEKGHILENVWQFAKLYDRVSAQDQSLSRWQPTVKVWQHGEETHVGGDGEPLEAYWRWREKGMANAYAVRYPNGYHGRHACVCALWRVDGVLQRLDYIAARKRIYCAEYVRLAPQQPHFTKLLKLLDAGVNLQIVEVDGPDPALTFAPYTELSSESPGLTITESVIDTLLHDKRKPFGHGYVIAALLLGHAEWLT